MEKGKETKEIRTLCRIKNMRKFSLDQELPHRNLSVHYDRKYDCYFIRRSFWTCEKFTLSAPFATIRT
jgi:hypothetical protein